MKPNSRPKLNKNILLTNMKERDKKIMMVSTIENFTNEEDNKNLRDQSLLKK
jgi:hypothetical protein